MKWYVELAEDALSGPVFDEVVFLPGGGLLCVTAEPVRKVAYGPAAWISAEGVEDE